MKPENRNESERLFKNLQSDLVTEFEIAAKMVANAISVTEVEATVSSLQYAHEELLEMLRLMDALESIMIRKEGTSPFTGKTEDEIHENLKILNEMLRMELKKSEQVAKDRKEVSTWSMEDILKEINERD